VKTVSQWKRGVLSAAGTPWRGVRDKTRGRSKHPRSRDYPRNSVDVQNSAPGFWTPTAIRVRSIPPARNDNARHTARKCAISDWKSQVFKEQTPRMQREGQDITYVDRLPVSLFGQRCMAAARKLEAAAIFRVFRFFGQQAIIYLDRARSCRRRREPFSFFCLFWPRIHHTADPCTRSSSARPTGDCHQFSKRRSAIDWNWLEDDPSLPSTSSLVAD
jgi:hypothetical protein